MQMSLEAYYTNFNPPDLHVAKVLSFPGFPTLLCSVSKGKDERYRKVQVHFLGGSTGL